MNANLDKIKENVSTTNSNTVPVSYVQEHGISIFDATSLMRSKFSDEFEKYSKRRSQCANLYHQHYRKLQSYVSLSGHSDTLSQEDFVQIQYSLLPYPAVNLHSLAKEKNHYTGEKRNFTFNVILADILENMNHFLYKGGNDFRYVYFPIKLKFFKLYTHFFYNIQIKILQW